MASGKTLQSTIEISGVLSPSLQTAIKSAVDRLEEMSKETLDSMGASAKLSAELDTQETVLKNLQRGYADFVLSGQDSSEEAQRLAAEIKDLSGDLVDNKKRLEEAEEAAKKLGNGCKGAGDDADEASEGFTVLKGAVADLAADAIRSAIDAFKELATEGDTALSMLEARTGVTGEKLEGFEDVLYDVYNNNYGESLGDVSEKLSTVIQMTDDLDNASLAKVTKNAIALEDVFGFDTVESMRAVNSLMDQFGITSEQAFNLIVQGAQKGLNQNDDLLDTINEYSVQFSGAGYSADDMFNMLANGAESGTWSVDKLGDAVKEFNIRMSDGTANDYLGQLGINAQKITEQFNKGGPEAQAAINQVMQAIQKCDDETLQYQVGVGLFGTMWEDLGGDAVAALMTTEGGISSVNAAMEQMDAAAYDNLESSLSQLGRTLESSVVQPLVEKLAPALKDAVDFVTEHVEPTVKWIGDNLPTVSVVLGGIAAALVAFNWGSIVGGITKVGGAFKSLGATMAANPIGLIILAVTALVAAFVYLWNNCEGFRNFWIGLWEGIKSAVSVAVDWIKGCWEKIKAFFTGDNPIANYFRMAWDNIKIIWDVVVSYFQMIWDNIKLVFSVVKSVLSGDFSGAWEAIKQIFANVGTFFSENVWGAIKAIFANVSGWFSSTFSAAWEAIKGIFAPVGAFFQGIWNKIVSIFTSIGTAVSDAISGAVRGAINAVLRGATNIINGFISAINFAIGIINAIPGVSISKLNLLNVPQFAAGGFTDGVSIAGEAGTEAVISFDPAYHARNVGIWEEAGRMLGVVGDEESSAGLTSKAGELLTLDDFSLGSLADGTSVVIYYDFSGFTWSPHIEAGDGDDADDIMARLRAHEAEFFDWLEEFIKMREVAQYA